MAKLVFTQSLIVLSCWLIPFSGIHPTSLQTRASTETIAYVRNGGQSGDQIRLIEANGRNDRALWTVPVADPFDRYELYSLAWSPDGTALAFSSDHEATCSIFASDLYRVGMDGSNVQRLGSGPTCDTLASYPQGSVTVSIHNVTSKIDTNFFIYVQGAPDVIGAVIPWNSVATVTFPQVADLGSSEQQVAVLQADDRWYVGTVDVKAGQTVTASPNPAPAMGDGIPSFGAWGPIWRSDGSRLGYARSSVACLNAYAIPADSPSVVTQGEPIIGADALAPCALAWGPTAATADQVVFLAFPNLGMDGATLYRATEGTVASSGTKLFSLDSTVMLLWFDWLPDGEGLLFVRTTKFMNTTFVEANLFEYNFASGVITQLTQLNDEFMRSFSISRDGQTIVFERAPTLDSAVSDLWLINRDGSNMRLLVADGRIPAWHSSESTLPAPTATTSPTATPTLPPATPTLLPAGQSSLYLPTVRR